MESHCEFCMTILLVNEHRREQGLERVSCYAVMSAFHWLKPKIKVIKKVESGGENADWISASYNICKQMQIMLGKLTVDDIMKDSEGKYSLTTNKEVIERLHLHILAN